MNVKSSLIASIDRDGSETVVTFRDGSVYSYEMDAAAHDALISADSVGKHFLGNVRGQFPTTKISGSVKNAA